MEIFIDSANVEEIRRWHGYGVVDGVTTNPTILLKDGGFDMGARAREIVALMTPSRSRNTALCITTLRDAKLERGAD